MNQARTPRFERYVAIGDSSTEGLEDPDGRGGYRGWANRLAEHIADAQGSLLYANLAVRGRHTRQIREQQLKPALADALGLPGADDAWARSLPPDAPKSGAQRLASEAAWVARFLLPWLWRHLQGRSSGDGLSAKRPELLEVLSRGGRR